MERGYWGEFDPVTAGVPMDSVFSNHVSLGTDDSQVDSFRFGFWYLIPGATEGPNRCPAVRGWNGEAPPGAISRCGDDWSGEFEGLSFQDEWPPGSGCPPPVTFEQAVTCRVVATTVEHHYEVPVLVEGTVFCDDLEITFTVGR